MRQVIMLLAALIFGGCALVHGGSGVDGTQAAWSTPELKGKQGMPLRHKTIQDLICQKGPSPQYPIFDPLGECI